MAGNMWLGVIKTNFWSVWIRNSIANRLDKKNTREDGREEGEQKAKE